MVDEARRGIGGCAVVEGARGMGKSELVTEVERYAIGHGVSVAKGLAGEAGFVKRFSTLTSVLRHISIEVGDFAIDASDDDADQVLVDQIADQLVKACGSGPMLVLVEDVHWADRSSLLALRLLVRALASSPLIWVFTRERDAGGSLNEEVLDWLIDEYAQHIELGALDEHAAVQLCEEMVGVPPSDRLRALSINLRANPSLLGEVLGSLNETGALETFQGLAMLRQTDPPEEIVHIVRRRIARISPTSQSVLTAVAVLGTSAAVHEVVRLLDLSEVEITYAASDVITQGFLVNDGGQLRFPDPYIADAVHRAIPEPDRSIVHAAAARVLTELGQHDSRIVRHLLYAGDSDSVRAAIVTMLDGSPNRAGR